jgi:hypothetical protein
MARSCGWCTHPDRDELERRVAQGESIRAVAADAGYSESAAQRHLRNHLQASLVDLRFERWANIVDFAERLAELLDDTSAVRAQAKATNNARLLLHAIREERDTLSFVCNRLGVESNDVVVSLREAAAMACAVRDVLWDHEPEIAHEISTLCRQRGERDLADAFENVANAMRNERAQLVTTPALSAPSTTSRKQ